MKTVNTVRFGDLTFHEKDIIRLSGGLIGLPALKDWIMLDMPDGVPMKWLQSLDRADFCVPVMEPHFFVDDYRPRIAAATWETIGADPAGESVLLIITTVHPGGERVTGNLMAPLLIDVERRRGGQVALDSDAYSVRQELNYLKFGLAVSTQAVENEDRGAPGEESTCPEDAHDAERLEVEL
jgi:flagellar assembly factor FliW